MWRRLFLCRWFKETFEKAQWRKVKQMWLVWLCILLCKQFTETCEKSQRGNVKQLWPVWQCIFLGYAIYRNLWKRTAEKIQTNVTSVTMHLFRQAIWKKHLKHSGENQTNAIGVTMNLIRNAIWRLIWKYTVEKSQTNATKQCLIWIRLHSEENTNKCNQCDFASLWANALTKHMKMHIKLWHRNSLIYGNWWCSIWCIQTLLDEMYF